MTGHEAAVISVRERLGERESRDQIVANLNFGFWSGMFSTRHDELWKHGLHRAFPHGPGLRKDIATPVDAVRKFRNRLAHHDSLLRVDIPFEMSRVFSIVAMIDPRAETWLRAVDQSLELYATKPASKIDTVLVPASEVFPFYVSHGAYVCQPGRHLRQISRFAFYSDGEIKPPIPRVLARYDNVLWSDEHAEELSLSTESADRKLGAVIHAAREHGWTQGRYQVFILSSEDDSQTRKLPQAIPHLRRGRGSAFVQRQRYFSVHRLETASSTEDLLE